MGVFVIWVLVIIDSKMRFISYDFSSVNKHSQEAVLGKIRHNLST